VDIDDPSQYEKDPLDSLRFAGDALDLYADGGNAPYAFGDGDRAEAWLVPAREYDELARALTWGHARDALDADPNAQEMYDQATRAALDRAEDSRELDRLQTMQLDEFVDALPDIAASIRSGHFQPIGITRRQAAEAVVLSHQQYADLLRAVLRWHQSAPFLQSLPAEEHRPTAGSQRFDAESLARSLGPTAEEVWREIQEERANGSDS
jgi:hypothetical protein